MAERAGLKLALFGGVYANLPALDAVLADVQRRDADAAWCLGDLGGFGPHVIETADRLRAAGVPMLRGNYDDAIGHALDDCACGYTDPRDRHYAQIAFDFTLARTPEHHRAWMRGLPETARIETDGRTVVLCHGSPRRVNEFLWDSTCSDAFLEWLCDQAGADVIACTHTGLPWHRALPSGRQVVNVGAIGRPANDGVPGATYALLTPGPEGGVEFRRVAYDHESVARDAERAGLPTGFADTLRTGWWTTCLENLPAPERARGRF
jgi:diadenosine tetraphosphatase ApaH/serine/threonine PP2A family protein phosphatase